MVIFGCASSTRLTQPAESNLMTKRLSHKTYRLEPVFADDFKTAANWRCEGVGAKMWTEDGWLICDATSGDVHAATIWCTAAEFSDPMWIEYRIKFLEGHFNGNLIVHAKASDGGDVLDSSPTRTGDYGEYHVFPNYILTFLNSGDSVRIRYRRDPGFELLGETFYQPALELHRTYEITILLQDGRVEYWVDGEKKYEGLDPHRPALRSGRIGLRTWKTRLAWSGFNVFRIVE